MKNPAVWLIPVLAFVLYLPYLNAGYFSDDFLFFYNTPPPHLYRYFLNVGAVAHAYRPLEAIYLTLVQSHFGFQTWPIHVVAAGAHMIVCGLVIAAATRLGFSTAQTILAATLTLVTQVGPPAILGNDTLSQAMSSMLGVLSLYLFATACFDREIHRRTRISWMLYWVAVACFMASLLFKETALGFSLILCAIALAASPAPSRIGHATRLVLPFAIAGAIYMLARIHAGGQVAAQDDYKIGVGFNVIRNLALFAAGALSPVSSVSAAMAAQTRDNMILAGVVAGALLVTVTIAAGILMTSRKGVVAWLLGCSLAALFPAFVLQHVSELYFYNAVPFVALLFSLAVGTLWNRGLLARAGVAVCTFLLIGGQVFACLQKATLMKDNGRRAAAIIADLVPRIRSLPQGGRIILVQPPGKRLKYSVYVLEAFDVLEFGAGRMGSIFGRPDVLVSIAEAGTALPDSHTVMLTLDGGVLRDWEPFGR